MSFWAEIGVSKAKEQVVGDDEAVMPPNPELTHSLLVVALPGECGQRPSRAAVPVLNSHGSSGPNNYSLLAFQRCEAQGRIPRQAFGPGRGL
jgi:hypothetical protein